MDSTLHRVFRNILFTMHLTHKCICFKKAWLLFFWFTKEKEKYLNFYVVRLPENMKIHSRHQRNHEENILCVKCVNDLNYNRYQKINRNNLILISSKSSAYNELFVLMSLQNYLTLWSTQYAIHINLLPFTQNVEI